MNWLALQWTDLRASLRRWPWLDSTQAAMIIGWGLIALFSTRQALCHSRFCSLAASTQIAATIALMAGLYQFSVGLLDWQRRRSGRASLMRSRTIAGFTGFWVTVSLAFSVDSATGVLSWGGHAFMELIICLALVP